MAVGWERVGVEPSIEIGGGRHSQPLLRGSKKKITSNSKSNRCLVSEFYGTGGGKSKKKIHETFAWGLVFRVLSDFKLSE